MATPTEELLAKQQNKPDVLSQEKAKPKTSKPSGTPGESAIEKGVVEPPKEIQQPQQEKPLTVQEKQDYGLVAVDESYAEQAPMSVIEIGGQYYRSVGVGERKQGESSGDYYARMLRERNIIPEGALPPEGTVYTGGTPGEVVRGAGLVSPEPLPKGTAGEQALLSEKEIEELGLPPVLEEREREYRQGAEIRVHNIEAFKSLLEFEEAVKRDNPALYNIYKEGGLSAYNQAINMLDKIPTSQYVALKELEPFKQKSFYVGQPDSYNIVDFLKENPEKTDVLYAAGFDRRAIELAGLSANVQGELWWYKGKLITEEERNRLLENYKIKTEQYRNGEIQLADIGDNPSDIMTKQSDEITRELIVNAIPIVGTINYANKASRDGFTNSEKAWLAASIALDVISLIPLVGAAAAGAREAGGITRTGRALGALKGLGRGALMEVSAPYTILAHPLETVKGLYKPVEILLFPRRIPTAAAETSFHTIKLDAGFIESGKEAKKLQDIVTSKAISGEKAVATIDDVEFELVPTALQKTISPVAVSATPDIRPFLNGAEITPDLFVSPSLHTRFAEATSIGAIPEGNIKGALFIRDKRVLDALESSQKMYKGTAEVEKVIPGGIKLPPPSQILYTRDAGGDLIHILVFGDKLSPLEIAKLKVIGAVDTIRQMYTPPAFVREGEGAIKSVDELAELQRIIVKKQDDLIALKGTKNVDEIAKAEGELADLGRRYEAMANSINTYADLRLGLKAAVLNYGDYDPLKELERIQEEYRQTNPPEDTYAPYELVRRAAAETRREFGLSDRTPLRVSRNQQNDRLLITTRREIIDPRNNVPRRIIEPPRETIPPDRLVPPVRETPPIRIVPPDRTIIPPRDSIEPPRDVPPPRIPVPPPDIPFVPTTEIGTASDYESKVARIKPGSVAWIQGRPSYRDGSVAPMYKVIVPPYGQEDMFTMRQTPPEYEDKGWSGEGSAQKSLQIIGGMPSSNINDIDLGWARININVESGQPSIEYVHDEDANVGARQQTVGMGRGQIPVEEWEEAKAQGIKYTDFIKQYQRGTSAENRASVKNDRRLLPDVVPDNSNKLAEAIIMTDLEAQEEEEKERKRRNQKDWWDEDMYQKPVNNNYVPTARYYRGRRLLPPNLEANL